MSLPATPAFAASPDLTFIDQPAVSTNHTISTADSVTNAARCQCAGLRVGDAVARVSGPNALHVSTSATNPDCAAVAGAPTTPQHGIPTNEGIPSNGTTQSGRSPRAVNGICESGDPAFSPGRPSQSAIFPQALAESIGSASGGIPQPGGRELNSYNPTEGNIAAPDGQRNTRIADGSSTASGIHFSSRPEVDPAAVGTSGVSGVGRGVVPPAEIPVESTRLAGALAHESVATSRPPEVSTRPTDRVHTDADWAEANARAQLCERFIALRGDGYSVRHAALQLGRSVATFSGSDSLLERYQRGGVQAMLPDRRACGAKPTFTVPGWFVPAARFFWLLTNRTWNSGSIPEAIRRTISLPNTPVGWDDCTRRRLMRAVGLDELPECPGALRETILERQARGQDLVPERIARQITAPEAVVIQHRHPKNADLDYRCASGTMMWDRSAGADEYRFYRAGDLVEADDATISFPVCVPWTLGGNKCSDKYHVRVGRFQWLVSIDVGSRFVTGYTYTARPRSSYRAEDVLSLIRIICRQHGVPRGFRLEKGVWKSHLVTGAVRGLGSRLITVHSPHNKPYIEGLFNTLWTKLSVQFPDGHLGRTRDEEQAANDILTACQRGTRDPRRHFPMLADALAAFDEVINEKNRTPIHTAQYGSWVPEERWEEQLTPAPLNSFPAESEWLFSPFVREWTVRGMLVRGRIPLFEDLSVPFDFSAPWMADFHGAKVRCYFDPSEPRCAATVVLVNAAGTHPAGEVLGVAQQINEVAGYARMVMGWGDDARNAGLLARQQSAKAVRREVRAVLPRGRRGAAASEEHDGVAASRSVHQDGASRACADNSHAGSCFPVIGPEIGTGCGNNRDAGDRLETRSRLEATSVEVESIGRRPITSAPEDHEAIGFHRSLQVSVCEEFEDLTSQ
jgi:hypothetical protein